MINILVNSFEIMPSYCLYNMVILKPFHTDFSLVFKIENYIGCRDKLVISSYGLDKSTWDPSTDYFLPEVFNSENMNGKAVCKNAMLQRLGLSEHSSIILVSGSPLILFKPHLFVCMTGVYEEKFNSLFYFFYQVGCIFSEGADIDEKKMKDIVLNAKQHDVQVATSTELIFSLLIRPPPLLISKRSSKQVDNAYEFLYIFLEYKHSY